MTAFDFQGSNKTTLSSPYQLAPKLHKNKSKACPEENVWTDSNYPLWHCKGKSSAINQAPTVGPKALGHEKESTQMLSLPACACWQWLSEETALTGTGDFWVWCRQWWVYSTYAPIPSRSTPLWRIGASTSSSNGTLHRRRVQLKRSLFGLGSRPLFPLSLCAVYLWYVVLLGVWVTVKDFLVSFESHLGYFCGGLACVNSNSSSAGPFLSHPAEAAAGNLRDTHKCNNMKNVRKIEN